MAISEIFCQDKAVSILQRAFASDKVPHAYIFAGAEGIGKFKTAGQWAKLLLCAKPIKAEGQTADSCGQCQSCQLFDAGLHPDFNHIYKELLEYTKDGKGKTIPVDLPIDVIRQFLIAKVSVRPTLSQRKVFVVTEAERLNAASQNALLKVLEEPPGYCCIILICTRLEKLLPTTKSRCQVIRFGRIEEGRIVEKLKEMGLKQDTAKYFTRLAQGSIGLACKWAQLESEGANLYAMKKQLVESVTTFKLDTTLDLAQRCVADSKAIAAVLAKIDPETSKTHINRTAAKTIMRIIIAALYDAMMLDAEAAKEIINFDQTAMIKKLADRLGAETAGEKITQACQTMQWIDASVNEKLIFEHLLLNIADYSTIRV